jgi:hypothetical protein
MLGRSDCTDRWQLADKKPKAVGASYKDLLYVRRRFITKDHYVGCHLGEWSMRSFVSDIRASGAKDHGLHKWADAGLKELFLDR